MFHQAHRLSLLALVLTGLLIPASQTLAADPPLPAYQKLFRCDFVFKDGFSGSFDMSYVVPWTARHPPGPNKLWVGELQNASNPPVGVDLAWKPGELEFLELTIRKQGKQCKKFDVQKRDLPYGCWEFNRAENCEGGGLENLAYQQCRVFYPGRCQ